MFNQFNRFDDQQNVVNRNLEVEKQGLLSADGHKNRLRNIFYVLPLAFLVAALCLSAVLLHNVKGYRGDSTNGANAALQYLSSNLNQVPLQNLAVVVKGAPCPNGFVQENLGEWRGAKSGCLCTDGSVHTSTYCSFQSDSQCKSTSKVNSQQYSVFAGQSICSQRYAATNFAYSSKSSACAAGQVKCQTNVCVTSGVICPITSATIDLAAAPTAGDANELAFGAGKLVLKREVTAPVIANFEAEQNFPCNAHSTKRPQTVSKKAYPLDQVQNNGCGSYDSVQNYATNVGADQKPADFYADNSLANTVTNLPFQAAYTDALKDKVSLFAIQRVPVVDSAECQKINTNGLKDFSNDLNQLTYTVYVIAIIIIVLAAIGIFLSFLFLFLRHALSFLNKRPALALILVIAVLVAILSIILFGIYYGTQNSDSVQGTRNSLQGYVDNGCFEKVPGFDQASEDLVYQSDHLGNNLGYLVIALFVLALIFLLVTLVALVLRKAKGMVPLPDPAV